MVIATDTNLSTIGGGAGAGGCIIEGRLTPIILNMYCTSSVSLQSSEVDDGQWECEPRGQFDVSRFWQDQLVTQQTVT